MSTQAPLRYPGQKPPEPEQKFRCQRCSDTGLVPLDSSDPPRHGGEVESKLLPCTCAAGTEKAPILARLLQDTCECGQPATALSPRCAECDAKLIAEYRRAQEARWS